jgi:hypothetical protein
MFLKTWICVAIVCCLLGSMYVVGGLVRESKTLRNKK